MKQKFKFKALNYKGKIVFFTKEYNCPDFEIIPSKKLNKIELPETTIESQLMDWLDNQNKEELMIEKNVSIIFDYWIVKKNPVKLTIFDYLKQLNIPEQMLFDLTAIYKEIKPILKGKSINKQIEILFSHLNIGYKVSSTSYKNILKILKEDKSDDEIKLLN